MIKDLKTVCIQHNQSLDARIFGPKASNLASLVNLVPIPRTYAISKSLHTSVTEIVAIARTIAHYSPSGLVCLRSSMPDEDQSDQSMAGQYESHFRLDPSCVTFAANLRAYEESLNTGSNDDADEIVSYILQPHISAEVFGVYFENHPLGHIRECAVTEWTYAHGTQLTDGSLTPTSTLISQRSRRVISGGQEYSEQFEHLAELAQLAQAQLDTPLDIEYAIVNRQVIVLQARAITAITSLEDTQLWSHRAANEFWSGYVTQPMFDCVSPTIENHMLRRPLATIGLTTTAQRPLIKRFEGHIYLNCEPLQSVVSALPRWAQLPDLLAFAGIDERPLRIWPLWTIATTRIILNLLHSRIDFWPWQTWSQQAALQSRAQVLRLQQSRFDQSRSVQRYFNTAIEHHLELSVFGMVWAYVFGNLGKIIVQSLLGDAGLTAMLAANPHDPVFRRLSAMSQLRSHENKHLDIAQLWPYGAFDRDIQSDRWSDRPELIRSMIEDTLSTAAQSSFHTTRNMLEGSSLTPLLHWLYLPFLWLVVALTRRAVGYREYMRYHSDILLWPSSVSARNAAPVSTEPNDLEPTLAPVHQWLQGNTPIANDEIQDTKSDNSKAISGSTIVAGDVHAPICIVRSYRDLDRVTPGTILLLPYLDPSLAPLLQHCQGLVLVAGGTLSHGAILAREYGVPTINNIAYVPTIPDGTTVHLDATRGILTW